jgi:hypothetical protein
MDAPSELIRIGGVDVAPGERALIDLPVANLYTRGEVHMPVRVVRGKEDGPTLFVSAAIHGDEINGVEIIRRLLKSPQMKKLRGTLITVPVVNVFGFNTHSRYLPDRRDLNRSFPGSEKGSLAARLAHLFMTEIAAKSTHGIDLHTGAVHRSNLSQIRGWLKLEGVEAMARSFDVPVIIDAEVRDGSLRAAAAERSIPLVVYEAGEALRFDGVAIRGGVRGVLNVMSALGMLPPSRVKRREHEPFVARSTTWVRAQESGILRAAVRLGGHVQQGELIGRISDAFGGAEVEVLSPCSGIVVGMINMPLVNEGDALCHIAQFAEDEPVAEAVEAFQAAYAAPQSIDPQEGGT